MSDHCVCGAPIERTDDEKRMLRLGNIAAGVLARTHARYHTDGCEGCAHEADAAEAIRACEAIVIEVYGPCALRKLGYRTLREGR
jgi:hypothetical protein